MIAPSTPAHRVCSYHPPTEMQQIRYGKIRAAVQILIETIVDMCPPSADRSAAIRIIREGAMAANASIAVDQDDVNLLNREPQVPDELLLDYTVGVGINDDIDDEEADIDDLDLDDEDRPF